MGVHTGDSVTVAPAQTLTDRLYQELRDQALRVIRAVGVETGGSNIQFAVNPATGEIVVIEMNPRVSRSSALASKATGFPIAKIAARLAVGYALEEIPNDITRATPASFEPTIDYVVVKVPRFAFEKFPGAEGRLTTHMKSVGEVMAIGRTFRESFAKAMRSRELDDDAGRVPADTEELLERLETPALGSLRPDPGGVSPRTSRSRRSASAPRSTRGSCASCRRWRPRATGPRGWAGRSSPSTPAPPSSRRARPTTTRPTSATRALIGEVRRGDRASVVILGSGPNRIGQGIEFDYCCVHAAMTVRESGRDAVMVNCNPETVSTDYDTSDRLYFEPLTADDVLAVIEVEQPGGRDRPVRRPDAAASSRGRSRRPGCALLGTPVDAIDLAEDRGRFGALLRRLEIAHPALRDGALGRRGRGDRRGRRLSRCWCGPPTCSAAGRWRSATPPEGLDAYLEANVKADQEHPLLLDRFLEDAIEVDVDALADGEDVRVAGIMQHVEEAGVHSGDSACVIPPMSLGEEMLEEIRETTRRIALELGVIGLINIQYAVAGGKLHVIEANPRASRTVPFVSKAIGAPLAKIACRLMLGERLADQELPTMPSGHVSVKEAVLPFARFAGADSVLGPEMKSTGEVMGVAADFPTAFGKAQAAAGIALPAEGTVFITVTDTDKPAATQLAARFHDLGFEIIATRGTAQAISRMGVPVRAINKIADGSPHVVDYIREGEVDLVINTPTGSGARTDGYEIRTAAVRQGHPLHHDDDRRLGRGPRDRRAARGSGRAELAAGAARGGRAPSTPRADDRAGHGLHPGAAAARWSPTRAAGGYRIFSALDAEGPEPRGGPVLHARRGRRLGWGRRPAVPAACLLGGGRGPSPSGVRLDFLVEAVGPGTQRLAALAEGEGLWLTGPLGRPFSMPARDQRRRGGGDPGRRRDRDRAAGDLLAASSSDGGIPQRVAARLSRPRPLGRGRGAVRLLRGAPRQRGRPRRPPRLRHRPARGAAGGRRGRRRPSSTPAGRRRCWRRCASSAIAAACRRSWRWRRRWPAASAPASAARCRWPPAATCASASTGRWSARTQITSALVAGAGHR